MNIDNKLIEINGFHGSGKTLLARKLGNVLSAHEYTIYIISADSKENVETELRALFKNNDESEYENILEETCLNFVNSYQPILFILDDVQHWDDIKKIVMRFSPIQKLKFLINTRKNSLMPNSIIFQIGSFTTEEANQYIKSLCSHKFNDMEIETLISLIEIDNEIWPSKLCSFVEHINNEIMDNFESFLARLKNDISIFKRDKIFDFDTLEEKQLNFLLFSSYFNVEYIKNSIVRNLCETNNFNTIIDSLSDEGFLIKKRNGIEIKRIVQHEFLQYKYENSEKFLCEHEILNKILRILKGMLFGEGQVYFW